MLNDAILDPNTFRSGICILDIYNFYLINAINSIGFYYLWQLIGASDSPSPENDESFVRIVRTSCAIRDAHSDVRLIDNDTKISI